MAQDILTDAYTSLGKDVNKAATVQDEAEKQGVVSALSPELELPMKDEELIKVTRSWKAQWDDSDVKSDWLKHADENRDYWLGKQHGKLGDDEKRAMVDNLIFEALESFLPQATRRNPEPMVSAEGDEQETQDPQQKEKQKIDKQFTDKVKFKLAYLADILRLRLKIKKVARNWAINLLGVGKVGWNVDNDEIALKAISPRKLILDPKAIIDEDGYHGRFIGEYRTLEAGILARIVKKEKSFIEDLVKDKDGTNVQFIEWNTAEYFCWTLNDEVLLKGKNLNWNYDSESQQPQVDDVGNETTQAVPVKGINHFPTPRIPYIFLTIFNLGEKPVDDTSLIGQNLANQDMMNKRNRQIDHNNDNQNGGMVVSLERSGLTKEQAKGVTEALKRGGTVMIPAGSPGDAVQRFPGNPLVSDVYMQLQDMRTRMRDIFGIRGLTPAGIKNEDTARGKILTRGLDGDRIGGGITEYLEQFSDDFYNWCVQMIYVHYPEVKQLFDTGYQPPKLNVSVKEGSLLPKDSTTLANQAIELAGTGKMSLIDLYKRLEYPDPEELAANVWLEINAPELLFRDNPLVQQAIQMRQAAMANAHKPPGESMNFKDLPPEGQAQMAKQAGIQLSPIQIAVHQQRQDNKEQQKAAQQASLKTAGQGGAPSG